MNQIKTLIDFLQEKVKTEGDWALYRFVDFDDETEKWILEDHTIGELYQKALEIAYMLRKRDCAPATGPSSFPCRISELSMPCMAV